MLVLLFLLCENLVKSRLRGATKVCAKDSHISLGQLREVSEGPLYD